MTRCFYQGIRVLFRPSMPYSKTFALYIDQVAKRINSTVPHRCQQTILVAAGTETENTQVGYSVLTPPPGFGYTCDNVHIAPRAGRHAHYHKGCPHAYCNRNESPRTTFEGKGWSGKCVVGCIFFFIQTTPELSFAP